ncbi:hypothetical protein GCT13_19085 [Paraburkholderia sp. CNPSo 3157]|uniref:Uncharacterized protein n=1 Tax=Paraburkholderia franconis TaxID=2654983 RepID=A0A7X1TGW9_9BURK|nr:hypothetical protein [Paraburkholderia franconis]MPW18945.1 hypothetical protein [Paraburkholderia franconis]
MKMPATANLKLWRLWDGKEVTDAMKKKFSVSPVECAAHFATSCCSVEGCRASMASFSLYLVATAIAAAHLQERLVTPLQDSFAVFAFEQT